MPRLRAAKMTLFQKKYRIESARHPIWNYGGNAYYFVTICTKNRACLLGGIRNGTIALSLQGSITYQSWQDIPKHYPGVQLDEFVVMPNHLHGILVFNQTVAAGLGAVVGSFKAAVTKTCRSQDLLMAWQARYHDKMPWSSGLPALRKYIRDNPLHWEKDKLYRQL